MAGLIKIFGFCFLLLSVVGCKSIENSELCDANFEDCSRGSSSIADGKTSSPSSSSSSSLMAVYDISCPRGFSPGPGAPSGLFCVYTYDYVGGYAPSAECNGGLKANNFCFTPQTPCSWGLETEVCKSSTSSSNSSSSCPSGQTLIGGSCGWDDTCQYAPSTPRCTSSSSSSPSVSDRCSKFENTAAFFSYYTVDVQDSMDVQDGIEKVLWSADFTNGVLTLKREGSKVIGSYNCTDSQIVATYALAGVEEQHLIEIPDQNGNFIEFDPYGNGSVIYNANGPKEDLKSEDCNLVQGRSYGNIQGLYLDFDAEVNTVSYRAYFGDTYSGHYTCDAGALRLYLEAPEEESLVYVEVTDNGRQVRTDWRMYLDEIPAICDAQYAPVCAETTVEVQCVTTPCPPLTTQQTYSNACTAFVDHAVILFDGECAVK